MLMWRGESTVTPGQRRKSATTTPKTQRTKCRGAEGFGGYEEERDGPRSKPHGDVHYSYSEYSECAERSKPEAGVALHGNDERTLVESGVHTYQVL